jgi:hypothetical protein
MTGGASYPFAKPGSATKTRKHEEEFLFQLLRAFVLSWLHFGNDKSIDWIPK